MNKWIRTSAGFAGKNGYLIKIKGGYQAYVYGDNDFFITQLASDAKKYLDNWKPSESEGVRGPEVTD